VPLDQLADAGLEGPGRGRADLEPEAAQHPAQVHLDVVALGLQQLARRQQRAGLLRRQRLAVHRLEPAEAHQLRDPARVLLVGLHRHRLERRTHVPGLQEFGGEAGVTQTGEQPLRQRPRFQADPRQVERLRPQPRHQRLRLGRQLGLDDDLAAAVHHADARAFQRHVDPGIVLHGRPSMRLGAATADAVQHTIIRRDGRPNASPSVPPAR